MSVALYLNKLEFPSSLEKGCSPSFVKTWKKNWPSGYRIEDENVKILQQQRWTKYNFWSDTPTWPLRRWFMDPPFIQFFFYAAKQIYENMKII